MGCCTTRSARPCRPRARRSWLPRPAFCHERRPRECQPRRQPCRADRLRGRLLGAVVPGGDPRGGGSSIRVPNPVNVARELGDILTSGEFVADLRVTLTELFVAFAISAVSGVTLGYFISRSRYSIRVFDPLFSAIYSVPLILFLPLYILIFGLGPASKIALGASITFSPVVLTTIAGFGNADRTLLTT